MSSPGGRASRPGYSARTWCSPSLPSAWIAGATNASCTSPTATRSQPGRSSSRQASPGAVLACPRLEALIGSGVFYGSAGSETQAMEGRDVFVVGAGNSAGQTALHLARYARQVTMLVRGDSLARSMSDYLIREIEATPNLAVRLHTEITDGHGIRSPRHPHPARQPARPDRAGPGGRAVRPDRRRAAHPMAARGDPARLRLHPDRARRRAGRRPSVAVAARSRPAPARDLDTRSFRRRRRPLPLDQAGCLRRR